MKYDLLYVNGASHTKRNIDEKLWPDFLNEHLKLKYINQAEPGISPSKIILNSIIFLNNHKNLYNILPIIHIPSSILRKHILKKNKEEDIFLNQFPKDHFWTEYLINYDDEHNLYFSWLKDILLLQYFLKSNFNNYVILFDRKLRNTFNKNLKMVELERHLDLKNTMFMVEEFISISGTDHDNDHWDSETHSIFIKNIIIPFLKERKMIDV